jgi:2'-5' RNA ligase
MPNTSRLFFALWPDAKTRLALTRLNQSIATEEFKWVQPHNLHVTLVFLGHVDAGTELSIKKSVAAITSQPFTLTFDSLSYWSKPGILCLTCQQPAQEAVILAAELAGCVRSCGVTTDTRPYIPHITVARHVRDLPGVKFEPIAWRAEAFCLVESCREADGVCYKAIQQWLFTKPNTIPHQLL